VWYLFKWGVKHIVVRQQCSIVSEISTEVSVMQPYTWTAVCCGVYNIDAVCNSWNTCVSDW